MYNKINMRMKREICQDRSPYRGEESKAENLRDAYKVGMRTSGVHTGSEPDWSGLEWCQNQVLTHITHTQ